MTILYQCEECATLVDHRERDGYAYCDRHTTKTLAGVA